MLQVEIKYFVQNRRLGLAAFTAAILVISDESMLFNRVHHVLRPMCFGDIVELCFDQSNWAVSSSECSTEFAVS